MSDYEFEPLHDWVLLRRVKVEQHGGLILPGTAEEFRVYVEKLGPDVETAGLAIDDEVGIDAHCSVSMSPDGKYCLVKASDISHTVTRASVCQA